MQIFVITLLYIIGIVARASVVPAIQYIYTKHYKQSVSVYKFSNELFERHVATPVNMEIEAKMQAEYDTPLP